MPAVSVSKRYEEWFADLVGRDNDKFNSGASIKQKSRRSVTIVTTHGLRRHSRLKSNDKIPRYLQKANAIHDHARRPSKALLPKLAAEKVQEEDARELAQARQQVTQAREYYEKSKTKTNNDISDNQRRVHEQTLSKASFDTYEYIQPLSYSASTRTKKHVASTMLPLEPGIYLTPFIAMALQRQSVAYPGRCVEIPPIVATLLVDKGGKGQRTCAAMSDPASNTLHAFHVSRGGDMILSEQLERLIKCQPTPSENVSNIARPLAVVKRTYVDHENKYHTACVLCYSLGQVDTELEYNEQGLACVQPFIKAKGALPWTLRVAWTAEHGCNRTWMIRGVKPWATTQSISEAVREPFGERPNGLSSEIEKDSWFLGRKATGTQKTGFVAMEELITVASDPEVCGITPCQVGAWTDACEATATLAKSLRVHAKVPVNELVCDLIQDEVGKWWVLQVKAFRVQDLSPCRLHMWDEAKFVRKHISAKQNLLPAPGSEYGHNDKNNTLSETQHALVAQAIKAHRESGKRKGLLDKIPKRSQRVKQQRDEDNRSGNICKGDYCKDLVNELGKQGASQDANETEVTISEEFRKITFRRVLKDRAQNRAREALAKQTGDNRTGKGNGTMGNDLEHNNESKTLGSKLRSFLTAKERRDENKVVKVCARCYEIYTQLDRAKEANKKRRELRERRRFRVADAACRRLYGRFENDRHAKETERLTLMLTSDTDSSRETNKLASPICVTRGEHEKTHNDGEYVEHMRDSESDGGDAEWGAVMGETRRVRQAQGRGVGTGRSGLSIEVARAVALNISDRVMHYRVSDGIERAGVVVGIQHQQAGNGSLGSGDGGNPLRARYRVRLDSGKELVGVRAINLLKITAHSAADVLISSMSSPIPTAAHDRGSRSPSVLSVEESVHCAINSTPIDMSTNVLTSPMRNTVACPFECGEVIVAPTEASGVALTLTASHFLLQKHMLTCKRRIDVGGDGLEEEEEYEDESDLSSDSSVQSRNEYEGRNGGNNVFDSSSDGDSDDDDENSW